MQWPAILIACAALFFTVFSFWWMQWRVCRLRVFAPRTYAASTSDKLILLFPLVFRNPGPTPHVVRDLRLRFQDEQSGVPLDFQRIRSGINPSAHPQPLDLASPFPVPGNDVVRLFCEFEREPRDRQMMAGTHPLVLEGLIDENVEWRLLLAFDLYVNEGAANVMPNAFIAHLNRP